VSERVPEPEHGSLLSVQLSNGPSASSCIRGPPAPAKRIFGASFPERERAPRPPSHPRSSPRRRTRMSGFAHAWSRCLALERNQTFTGRFWQGNVRAWEQFANIQTHILRPSPSLGGGGAATTRPNPTVEELRGDRLTVSECFCRAHKSSIRVSVIVYPRARAAEGFKAPSTAEFFSSSERAASNELPHLRPIAVRAWIRNARASEIFHAGLL